MAIVVSAALELNVIDGLIVVEDTTDYAGQGLDITLAVGRISVYGVALYDNLGGITPDIVPNSSVYNTSTIDLPLDSDGNAEQGEYILTYVVLYNGVTTYTFNKTFTLEYTPPEVSIDTTYSCTASTLTSTDVTNYGTASIDRVHTITPPALGPAPTFAPYPAQTVTGNINTYSGITTGTWQASVVTDITVTFDADFTLVQTIGGENTIEIACDTALCRITCCLYTMRARAQASLRHKGPNNPYYQDLANQINEVEQLIVYYLLAEKCGNSTKTAYYLSEIQRVSGCDDSCDCSGGGTIPIIPASGSTGTYNVDSPNGTIDVTTEIVGNLTTFHIEVSETIIDIINNFYNTVVTSDDGSVTVVATTVGQVTTYDLSVNASSANSNRYYGLVRIYHNPAWATPGQPQWLIGITDEQMTGITFQTPTIGFGNTVPNALTDFAVIGVSDFWATGVPANSEFTCQANIMSYTDGSDISYVKDTEAEIFIFDFTTATFTARLWNPSKSGAPLVLSDLDTTIDYYLQISIHADDAIVIP